VPQIAAGDQRATREALQVHGQVLMASGLVLAALTLALAYSTAEPADLVGTLQGLAVAASGGQIVHRRRGGMLLALVYLAGFGSVLMGEALGLRSWVVILVGIALPLWMTFIWWRYRGERKPFASST
jgi:hypothetical protein